MNFKLLLAGITGFLIWNCSGKKTEIAWDVSFPTLGSESSPRAVDLNEDGVLDIVIGAGKNERQYSEQGVLALDGKTGNVLWQQETIDQAFGCPVFCDVNQDKVADVFIGGRSNILKAIDGKSGQVIWQYTYQYENDPVLKYARFEFFTGVLTPDLNGDGVSDLLVQNGGNIKAKPYSLEDRYPGVLMAIDSKTGTVLAADTMPDGRESYMSALYYEQPDGQKNIIFGSGGETFSGNLYVASLDDLLNKRLHQAKVVASEVGHGFIAPPSLADITGDGFYDIVAISHAGTAFAVDGKSLGLIWNRKINHVECSNSFGVGQFNDDEIPDFFTFASKGQWPNNTGSLQIAFNGKDGSILFQDSLGCTGFSAPVVYDINKDGIDEAILSINEFDCGRGMMDQLKATDVVNKLIAIDFANRATNTIEALPRFKNIFSTPWIGDLDRDGYLDIVHFQYFNPSSNMILFLGMRAKRISTSVRAPKPVKWGAYMGSKGDGVYEAEKR